MKTKITALLRRPLKATFFVALFVFGITAIIWFNQDGSTKSSNPFINISELPESFMAQYLSDYAEVATDSDTKKNILIVTSLEPLENTFGAKSVISAANHQYFLVYESDEAKEFAYEQISNTPDLSVAKNAIRTISEEGEGDDEYNSWGIKALGLDHAKELVENYENKSDIIVAILDTGLDVDLFNENYEEKLAGTYNVQKNTTKITDEVGHGTHIAGTIAEGTPSNVKIFSVKMTNTREIFSTDIVASVDYVTYYTDASVMNMSFGGYNYEEPEYLAIEAAKEKNIIGVAAAGNESTNDRSFPSSFDNTISISAIDNKNYLAEFSNFGSMVDFAAPGVDILSINGVMSGTSMATPHAVATVAIAKSFRKDLTFDETISFLKTRAVDLGVKGKDTRFGWGYVDYNGATLCSDLSEACDQFSIFEIDKQVDMEIGEPVLTKYNYGSLTNILATKVKFNYNSGIQKEKSLGDLGTDVKISGYNPYATGAQEVTVKYEEFTASFTVENPSNWESGWRYETIINTDKAAIREYRDHGLDIKTLYLPESDGEHSVTASYSGCMFNDNYDDMTSCIYPDSKDANYYETLIIPASYTYVTGFNGPLLGSQDKKLLNLYKIVYLGDELTLGHSAFSGLKGLISVEAKIKFYASEYGDGNGNSWIGYDGQIFYDDISLEHVTLAEGVEEIPEYTFSGCSSLAQIDLPSTVKTIGTAAFERSGIKNLHHDNIEKIKNQAFAGSKLEELYIPASTTFIANDAFSGTSQLRTIQVDQANPIYDSRDSSNAIILTAENKLLAGAYTTSVPSSVKIIGENSFRNKASLMKFVIPEGVETIEANAFADSYYLERVTLPRSLTTIDDTAFNNAGYGVPSRAVFMVWDNSDAYNRVKELNYPYILLDDLEEEPLLIANAAYEVIPEGHEFSALETLSPENFIIKIYYYDEENDVVLEEPEVIDNYTVIYNSGSTQELMGGYNMVSFIFDTAEGFKDIRIDLSLFANYLIPEYEIPTNISAYSGQALSEIDLPDGFSWMDGDEYVDESKNEYLAMFTPSDTVNYRVMPKIAIPITIKNGTTFAELFPDEVFRACIVENLNTQESAEYTQENIDLDKVFAMTELDCANGVNGEAIVNTRGIERLTELKSLNLSGNDISRINLTKNEKLESLKLRDTYISKLNLENNLKLSEFIINGYVIVDAATYAEVAYDENDNGHLIMNISKLDYLKNADFTIDVLTTMEEEHWEPVYDSDTSIIALNGAGMLEQIRFTVNLGGDEGTISYIINAHPRIMYFTTYFDGKLFDQEAGIMYGFTNSKLNINALAKEISEGFYGMSGYALEEYTIADDSDFIIGTKDVYFTFRFVKIASDDDEQDPGTGTEPGTEPLDGTDPVDEPEDEPQDVENPKTLDGTRIVMLVSIIVIASFALVGVSHRFGRRGR